MMTSSTPRIGARRRWPPIEHLRPPSSKRSPPTGKDAGKSGSAPSTAYPGAPPASATSRSAAYPGGLLRLVPTKPTQTARRRGALRRELSSARRHRYRFTYEGSHKRISGLRFFVDEDCGSMSRAQPVRSIALWRRSIISARTSSRAGSRRFLDTERMQVFQGESESSGKALVGVIEYRTRTDAAEMWCVYDADERLDPGRRCRDRTAFLSNRIVVWPHGNWTRMIRGETRMTRERLVGWPL